MTRREPRQYGCGTLLVLIVLVLVVWGVVSRSVDPGRPRDPAQAPRPAAPALAAGTRAVLEVPNAAEVFVADTWDSYTAFSDALAADDQVGVRELLLAGRLAVLPRGTPALVLETGIFGVRVRIQGGGKLDGQAVWTAREFVRPAP